MSLSVVDGSIIFFYLVATMFAGLAVRKYVGRVEHFLVAGREMGLSLGIASLSATEFGIVTCMYMAQNGYDKGFSAAIVGILGAAAMLFIGLTGFCVKPLRDAGVITIPELLEQRYGYGIRRLSGVVIILGGLLNMGVFLRMGGVFLTQVVGFPEGDLYLKLTMTALLLMVAVYTIVGGMLSVLVTDFLQFVVMSVGLILVTVVIMKDVGWAKLVETVQSHYGEGGFNPLVHSEMGWKYLVFNAMLQMAAMLTWQTKIQRLLAAKDSKTSRRIYTVSCFFTICACLLPGIWGIAAMATLPEGSLPVIDGKVATEYAMPMFLGSMIPIGLMGILVAAMLAAEMSTDSSYMLTWGSVIYNDIISRKRKARWSEPTRLFVNRVIIGAIGAFLLLYGLWYEIEGDVWTYLGLTGTIYLSSMSVLLIACCYWKHANNWGALAAIIVGAAFPSGFLFLQKVPGIVVWFIDSDASQTMAEWVHKIGMHDLSNVLHYLSSVADSITQIGPHMSGIIAYISAAAAMVIGSMVKNAMRGSESGAMRV